MTGHLADICTGVSPLHDGVLVASPTQEAVFRARSPFRP